MAMQAILTNPRISWKLDRRYLLTTALIVAVYVATADLGFLFADQVKYVTPVWPPTGISLAALLLLGPKYWRAIFLGALIANVTSGESLLVATGIALGNTLEAVIATAVLRRVIGLRDDFREPREVLGFAVIVAASTCVAAACGSLSLAFGGLISWSQLWGTLVLWWQGDLMSALLVTPLLMYYLDRRNFTILEGRWLEAGITLAATFALAIFVFTSRDPGPWAIPYLLFPVAIWAAVRFTQLGVVTSTFMIAMVAIWATMNGLGPFVGDGLLNLDLLRVEQFLCVLSATSLVLAMAIKQRLAAEQHLLHQTKQLERLDNELTEANRRITNILSDILEGSAGGKRNNNADQHKQKQL
jgi:integral membrane sensor domain MASE1